MIVIILIPNLPDLMRLIRGKMDPDEIPQLSSDLRLAELATELLTLFIQLDIVDVLSTPDIYDLPLDILTLLEDDSIADLCNTMVSSHLVHSFQHLASIKPINTRGDLVLRF